MKKILTVLFLFLFVSVLLTLSACQEQSSSHGENSRSDIKVKYLGGKIKFVSSLSDSDSPYEGPDDYHDYKWTRTASCRITAGNPYVFFNENYGFFLDGSAEGPRTLCEDPFCTHHWGNAYCITAYESNLAAPVGNTIFTENMNQVLYYNRETYELGIYAEFDETISALFSMGKYLYIVMKVVDEEDQVFNQYVRVDTTTNTAEYLDCLKGGGVYDPDVSDGMIYYLKDHTLTQVNSRLEEQDLKDPPRCKDFEVKENNVYYIPYDTIKGDQLWVYRLDTGENVRLLTEVSDFTVLEDRVYVIHCKENTSETGNVDGTETKEITDKLYVYALNDLMERKTSPSEIILLPEGYSHPWELCSGSNSLFMNLVPPMGIAIPPTYRYYIRGGSWQDISFEHLNHVEGLV